MKRFKNLLITSLLLLSFALLGQNDQHHDLFKIKPENFGSRVDNPKITYLEIHNETLIKLRSDEQDIITFNIPDAKRGQIQLQLKKAKIFSDQFLITLSSGKRFDGDKGIHYHGTINGDPKSLVAISIYNDHLSGMIIDQNASYNIGKIKNSNDYAFFKEKDLDHKMTRNCGINDKEFDFVMPMQQNVEERSAKTVLSYVETDYDMISDMGNANAVAAYATAILNQGIILFNNDDVDLKISQIKVWDTPSPYINDQSNYPAAAYLESFKANHGTFNGHVAQLMTRQRISGGLAAGIGGLCSNPDNSMCVYDIEGSYKEVPVYSWDASTWVHEVGHLMGSRHTHACVWNGNNTQIDDCASVQQYNNGNGTPLNELEGGDCFNPNNPILPSNGGFIMSYCDFLNNVGMNLSLGFGDQSGNVIRNNIANAGCITNEGGGTLSVDRQFVEIPSDGGCESINVTSTGAWAAEYDPNNPPFFLTNAAKIAGSGNAKIEFCAGKNTLPVAFYTAMYVYNNDTEIPIIIRQDSVRIPTAVFYPDNEKITPFTKETFSLNILTNTDWKLIQKEYDQKWVTIKSAKSGTKNSEFTVEVSKNSTGLNRYSKISMVYNNGLDTTYFTIYQPGENSGYLNVPSEFTAYKDENTYGFQVLSDLDWEIINDNPWVKDITPMKGKKNQIVKLTVLVNDQGVKRFGTLKFIAKTIGNDSIVKTVNINQLEERSGNSNIKDKVYPNPASDFINIELSTVNEEQIDAKVYDASGRIVKVLEQGKKIFGAFNHRYQINDLQAGFYTIHIKHGDSVIKEKLVIIK